MDSTKNAGKQLQKSYFDVLGLCCTSEIPVIERILNSLEGVRDFSVIVPTKTVIVFHDPLLVSHTQIVKALNQARLEANVKVHGPSNYKNRWPSPYAIASGALLLLSFLQFFYGPLEWLAIGAIAVGIIPIFLKAVASVRNVTLDINILVLIAVSGSIALHDYWEAATIVFLFTIAEWLESRASHKATSIMSSLANVVPQRAILAETGEEVNADEVKLNTLLAVKTGETVPVDGVVVEGNCEVDEKNLTGESFPVAKQKDSTVWAGTINVNGYISIKTTAVAEDCVVARMAKLVEEAQKNKSRTQRFIDKCAKYYTPAIVVISASLAVVPLAFRVHNKREWYHLALVVLVSGCPCALLLSTPVAMFCALSKAATLGVLIKGAENLEILARIKIMAFDKTGTITRGEFLVADVRSLQDDITSNTLLYWISSLETKSSHPMAAALIDFAREYGIEPKPEKVERFQNFPGEGICGRIDDVELYVGNSKIASRAGCTAVPNLEGYDVEGKSIGYVFLKSSLAGVFCLSDVCRTGAKEAINDIKSLGIKTVMLTGDSHAAAKHAQAQLGGSLDVIHAELLPEDKSRIITELQKKGPTAMIGDGVNDAPALATADIGISMGVSGSALATETGGIILMSNDIQRIPKAARLAKKVRRKVIENVIISISTKAAIVGLAIAGHPLVWAAVLTDVGTCLLVIFNSMLLLQGMPTRGNKWSRSSSHKHNHRHKCHATHGSSHTRDSCCSDIVSQKKCEPKLCSSKKCASKCGSGHSSSASCGNKKGPVLAKEHGCNSHNHPNNEAKTIDHQCCDKVSQDLLSQRAQRQGFSENAVSCESKKCLVSAKEHGCNACFHPHDETTITNHVCCGKDTLDLKSESAQMHVCPDNSKSCGSKKCSIAADERGRNAHNHPHSETKDVDHQGCGKVDRDLESQIVHHHVGFGNEESYGSATPAKEHRRSTNFHTHEVTKVIDHQCCGKVTQCLESKIAHNHEHSENASCRKKNDQVKSAHTHKGSHETHKCEQDNRNSPISHKKETSHYHHEKCCAHTSRNQEASHSECENRAFEDNKHLSSTLNMLAAKACEASNRTNLNGGLSEIVIA
ncbi:cadmium/zinc-transporting ATPase HMA3-like isoform X1 [Primulina eburnea]|uniref:cadmium/zinc-transporting ATPase HMA3-like isoform X1 n=1 Tax=Primulina eburnea TaxID=1245227 RepID=UPI003C6C27C8